MPGNGMLLEENEVGWPCVLRGGSHSYMRWIMNEENGARQEHVIKALLRRRNNECSS